MQTLAEINQMETCCIVSIVFAHYLKNTHELLKRNLKKTRAKIIAGYNMQCLTKEEKETGIAHYAMQYSEYKIGDKVLLYT